MREEIACAKTHVELLLSLLSRALRYVDNAPVGSAVEAGEVAALERQIRMALYLNNSLISLT